MREITEKYRCWDIMERKMKPVKGLYFGYCDEEGMHGKEITVLTGKPYVDEEMGKWKNCLTARPDLIDYEMSTASCVLMRFTGLLDKNGKEIYEGDLVMAFADLGHKGTKYMRRLCRMDWSELNHGFALFPYDRKDGSFWYPTRVSYIDIEVIGNKFENSELISK